MFISSVDSTVVDLDIVNYSHNEVTALRFPSHELVDVFFLLALIFSRKSNWRMLYNVATFIETKIDFIKMFRFLRESKWSMYEDEQIFYSCSRLNIFDALFRVSGRIFFVTRCLPLMLCRKKVFEWMNYQVYRANANTIVYVITVGHSNFPVVRQKK